MTRLMKRNTTIVLFASIFAVAVGTLGLSGNSTTLMVSAAPITQESMDMLGHVEYKLFDEIGNIKSYMQTDNVVVVAGKDCAASYLFTDSSAARDDCIAGNNFFTYIGVGNGTVATGSADVVNATLSEGVVGQSTGLCSATDAGAGRATGGDMARRNVTATFDSAGTATVVTLDTSGVGSDGPFTFDTSNATDVTDSGLFNADYETPIAATHECGGAGETGGTAGTDWNMFSRQLLNNNAGITVTDGDSLSVKWTITVG
jgi:hypothetical protein